MAFENQTLGQSMVRLFMGYISTRVIYVAAKLKLTDHIGGDGASAQDLAQKLKVDPAALYRVMRVLAGLGALRQDDNDRFYVTPFGETLRKDSSQSVRDYAIYSHEFVYDAFRGITDNVRTDHGFAGCLTTGLRRTFGPALKVRGPWLLSLCG
jgi:Dimerisation domain